MASHFKSLRELALAATSQISHSRERNPDGLLSLYETGSLFEITKRQIYLYVIAKNLPSVKLRHITKGDEFLMFNEEQVMEWFREGRYLDEPSGVWLDELTAFEPSWRSALAV